MTCSQCDRPEPLLKCSCGAFVCIDCFNNGAGNHKEGMYWDKKLEKEIEGNNQ